MTHEWNFENENIKSLHQMMDFPMDQEVFNLNLSEVDWNAYFKNYAYGIRKYLFKDSSESLQSSRKKLNRFAHSFDLKIIIQ